MAVKQEEVREESNWSNTGQTAVTGQTMVNGQTFRARARLTRAHPGPSRPDRMRIRSGPCRAVPPPCDIAPAEPPGPGWSGPAWSGENPFRPAAIGLSGRALAIFDPPRPFCPRHGGSGAAAVAAGAPSDNGCATAKQWRAGQTMACGSNDGVLVKRWRAGQTTAHGRLQRASPARKARAQPVVKSRPNRGQMVESWSDGGEAKGSGTNQGKGCAPGRRGSSRPGPKLVGKLTQNPGQNRQPGRGPPWGGD
jgi:hypothetical protein